MSPPPLPELLKAAKQLVRRADKDGILDTLTPRLIRHEIEKQFELEPGTLDAPEYKGKLRDAVTDALASGGEGDDDEEPTPKKVKKTNKEGGSKKKKSSEKPVAKKRKSSAVVVSDEEVPEVQAPSSPATKFENPASEKKRKISSALVVSDEEDVEVQASSPAPISEKLVSKKKYKSGAVVVSDEEEVEVSSPAPKSETSVSKKKLKFSAVVMSDEEEVEVQPSSSPAPKSKPALKKASVKETKTKSKPKRKSGSAAEESSSAGKKKQTVKKATKEFKSLEHVPTSDMEDDDPDDPAESSKLKLVEVKSKLDAPPPKRRKVSLPPSSDEDEEEDTKATVKRKDPSDKGDATVDEQPKKKRKVKSESTKEPKKPTTAKKARPTKENKGSSLTKDEETIKRLKSLVLACGVRHPWAKLFADLSASQQIKKLKEILADLGMKGRTSMEQAKAIREKRELAQELEDVQEFEKKVIEISSKRAQKQSQKPSGRLLKRDRDDGEEDSNSEHGDGSDSEDDVMPEKRRSTARKSIMAFLEDQSDEDD